MPSWLVDALVALFLFVIAFIMERQTEGRLFASQMFAVVAGGSFVLLRLGNLFARVGREVGCLFVFVMTWVLPCAAAFFLSINPDTRAVIQDSGSFFILLGFFLILIMVITFERLRLADETRFKPKPPSAQKKLDSCPPGGPPGGA